MKIHIDDLKAQERLTVGFKENLPGLEAVKPVIGDLCIQHGAWGVHVTGRVQTLLKLLCNRCLKAYFQSLNVDIDERLVYQSPDKQYGRERELNKDDFVEPIPSSGWLDISDIVYQAVTLATPTFCLCGTDCPGPPLGAGTDKLGPDNKESPREDPRWKNLKTLFGKEDRDKNS